MDIEILQEKLKRHKVFTYMIVHDIKHPTESLIKILDYLQTALQPDSLESILAMLSEMEGMNSIENE